MNDEEREVLKRLQPRTKDLQEGTDSEGGFLVPTDQRTEVIMATGTPSGVVRPVSRTFSTTRDGGTWPASTDDVDFAVVAEEAVFGEDDPVFSQVSFTIRKVGRMTQTSQELLEDSAVNVPALLTQLFQNGLGRYEDQQAIEGDGTTEPLGLRTTGAAQGNIGDSVADYNASTAPDWNDVTEHYFDLPAQWRGNLTWFTTSSFLRLLVNITGAGVPRVVEFMGDPIRPVILGRPVILYDGTGWDDAAAIATNEEFGAVGDFSQYYFIDRVGMTVQRSDERYFDTDQVAFKCRKRYDSLFAENDAFRIMKAAAS